MRNATLKSNTKKTYFWIFNIRLLLYIMSVVFLVNSGRKIVVVLRIFFKAKNHNGIEIADQLEISYQRKEGGYCKPSKWMILNDF